MTAKSALHLKRSELWFLWLHDGLWFHHTILIVDS